MAGKRGNGKRGKGGKGSGGRQQDHESGSPQARAKKNAPTRGNDEEKDVTPKDPYQWGASDLNFCDDTPIFNGLDDRDYGDEEEDNLYSYYEDEHGMDEEQDYFEEERAPDFTHDGLWSYCGTDAMMVIFDDNEFMNLQEDEWQRDLLDDPNLKREDEFVELKPDTIIELVASLKDRDIHIASGVLRRILTHTPYPPEVRITRLPDDEMEEFLAMKKEGNDLFLAKKYQEAADMYDEALISLLSGPCYITPKNQVKEMINVLSNQAECYLRLQNYDAAGRVATEALLFDGDHVKSRVRRAKAELALYKKKFTLPALAQAGNDLQMVVNDPEADKLAIESAEKMLAEIHEYLKVEKLKCSKEKNPDYFDSMMQTVVQSCWVDDVFSRVAQF